MVHQSVYELVHSEDREELQRQLTWNSQLPADSGLSLLDALRPDNSMILERSFTVRFRCLLDNTSGFLVRNIFTHFFLFSEENKKNLRKDARAERMSNLTSSLEFHRNVTRTICLGGFDQ